MGGRGRGRNGKQGDQMASRARPNKTLSTRDWQRLGRGPRSHPPFDKKVHDNAGKRANEVIDR